jgi:uncharacterized protein YndB with AHSA1/START domain
MKPYRETHTLEGVLDAPIERAWALHANPEEMRSVFARILETEIVAGRPGEVGCVARSTMRTAKGRVGNTETEVIEADPPHRLTIRTVVRETPRITYESTRTFRPEGYHTLTSLIASAQTVPVPWFVRVALGLSRAKRAREFAAEFASETAEENAYYKASTV